MVIFVDPSVANPEPPEVIVSPDGILTATVHEAGGGVFLEADFRPVGTPGVPGVPEQVLRTNYCPNPSFETDTVGWRESGATIASTAAEAYAGTHSLQVTTAAAASTEGIFMPSVAREDLIGQQVTVQATVKAPLGATMRLSVSEVGTSTTHQDFTGTGDWETVTVTMDAPSITGKPYPLVWTFGTQAITFYVDAVIISTAPGPFFDGQTAPDGAKRYRTVGDRHEEYIPAVDPIPPGDPVPEAPVWVRFERDGEPIFSGDPAAAPGGYGVAYDMFAPLGVPVSYRAVPIFSDGTEGSPSEAVAVVLKAPAKWGNRRRVVWLKSARNPGLSMRVLAIGEPPTFDREGRVSLHPVPGTPLPAGSSDVQTSWSFSLEFLTESTAEQERMESLLTSGTLLLQAPASWQLRDLWVEPGTVGMVPHARMDTGAQRWTVGLTEVAQPSTADTPLIIPGRSWQWATDEHTWNSLNAVFDSWLDVVRPPAGAA